MAPARLLPSGEAALLLEREAQVAALEALADAARSGGGRFAVIEGTAGIGQTRLLPRARGGGLRAALASAIVPQLFEPLLTSASADLRAELLSGPAALVEPLVG